MKRRLASRIVSAAMDCRSVVGGAICGAALFSVVAAAQDPAIVENQEEITATVTDIDPETRLISLETEDGEALVVEAGDEVRNFDQIEVGNRVDVVYYQALAAEATEEPATDEEEPVVVGSTRSAVGERPAGAVGLVYTAIVTIDEVDLEQNQVSFTGPGGQQRMVNVQSPEMQEFIKDLESGDRVRLTYGEALAVGVQPADTQVASPN